MSYAKPCYAQARTLSISWQKTLPGLLLWMLVRRARRSQVSAPPDGSRRTSGRGEREGVGGEMAGAVGVEVGADEEATAELEVEVDAEIGMVARGGSEMREMSSAEVEVGGGRSGCAQGYWRH